MLVYSTVDKIQKFQKGGFMNIREISSKEITQTIRRLCIEANTVLGDDMIRALEKGLQNEKSSVERNIFNIHSE